MKYVRLFLFYVLCSNISLAQVDDDNCYEAVFTEGTKSCSDFENKIFICTLNIEIAPESDEGESGMVLSGEMQLTEDLGEEYEVDLKVSKDIGTGKQFMYNIEGNLCDSLKKNDTPWKPLADGLQTTECPVKKGVYPVENLKMSLEFAKKVVTHEFVGDYVVEIAITTTDKRISCYELGVAIEEIACK